MFNAEVAREILFAPSEVLHDGFEWKYINLFNAKDIQPHSRTVRELNKSRDRPWPTQGIERLN